ncbi:MAG: hypothetical protein HY064_00695 [Bacteroidetes bacterium]|nr:hypothetical protein [Bacteroidota bacterium]
MIPVKIITFSLFLFVSAHSQDTLQIKDGLQNKFYPNGKLKSKIYFKDGEAFGFAMLFNKEGNLSEAGHWYNRRWVGNYVLYWPNGVKRQEFNYDVNGKRIGTQTYYYTNGIISHIVFMKEGFEEGPMYDFDSLGNFITKRKNVFDSVARKMREVPTTESFPEDSSTIDYVKNQNANIFRIVNLEKAETEAKLNSVKLKSEKQKNLLYLIFSIVFGLALIAILYSYYQVRKNKRKMEIQNKIISQKQKEILDSIHYASRIQRALITSEKYIEQQLRKQKSKNS